MYNIQLSILFFNILTRSQTLIFNENRSIATTYMFRYTEYTVKETAFKTSFFKLHKILKSIREPLAYAERSK